MAGSSGRSLIAGPRDRVVVRMSLVLMLVLLVLGVSINVVNAENCGCASGLCCSKWGYCGSTTAYCSDGCQSGPCYNSGGGSVANIVSRSFFDGLLNTPSLPNCGCASGLCCSQHGYCGATSDYCGDGCQSGPCSGGGSPSGGGGNVGTIISQSFFDGLAGGAASSCEGKGFYTHDAFIAAANAYSGFGTTGADDVQKRELAAFFANVMHETGGLCSINEINPPQLYCDPSYTTWPCTSGKSYHGRGPLQLSWNFNYGAAGQNIGFDGLNNPEKVEQDATISFKTAVWFWMKNRNCHSAITSGQGFGATIKAINSGECNGGKSGQVSSRVNYYNTICSQLGVDPGANVSC